MTWVLNKEEWGARIQEAQDRIQDDVRITPLEFSPGLSELTQGKVYIKLESEQLTGSFKVRGAFNKLRLIQERESVGQPLRPVLSSSGNHAIACNHAMSRLGMTGTTFVPTCVSAGKEEALRRLGAQVVKYGTDCMDTEVKARSTAEAEGRPYISPYNDEDVIAGQATVGAEILKQCPDVDVVLVPVGGGGLVSGIAIYFHLHKPSVRVVGCCPTSSKVMYESVRAGHLLYEASAPTLSDGTAGGVEPGSATFEPCLHLVSDWATVSEDELERALCFIVDQHHKLVEGAACNPVAAVQTSPELYRGQTVVCVASGANIGISALTEVLTRRQHRT